MPVAPMTYYPSSGRTTYYSNRSNPSTSSLLGRTTSLERSNYSYSSPSYGLSSYTPYGGTSSYSSRYSSTPSSTSANKPPRPSYSSSAYSSTDSYRLRNTRDSSPVRSSYVRNTSESRDTESRSKDTRYESANRTIGARSISDTSSRYAASTISSRLRDTSTSRDSGYGSRLTSRDRSLDIKNGNAFESRSYGPSTSSYASNYRWEDRNKNKETKLETEAEETEAQAKIRVSDRIRNFEPCDEDNLSVSTLSLAPVSDELARWKREEERLAARRERLGLKQIEKSRSRTPDYHNQRTSHKTEYGKKSSPESNGNDDTETEIERRPSVTELRRKYDASNVNGYSSTSKEEDDYNDDGTDSLALLTRNTPTIRCESPPYTSSRRRTDSDTYSCDSPISSKYSSDYSSINKIDTETARDSGRDYRASNRLESPVTTRRNLDSPKSRSPDTRKSPLTNGTSVKVSVQEKISRFFSYICF